MSVLDTAIRVPIIDKPALDRVWFNPMPGEQIALHVRSTDVMGAFTVLESVSEPMSGPPLHVHEAEVEMFHILEGTLHFVRGDEEFDAPVGTSVTIPEGVAHAWTNASDAPARALVVFTPGRMEELFEAMEGLSFPEIERLAAEFDTFVVGPPIGG